MRLRPRARNRQTASQRGNPRPAPSTSRPYHEGSHIVIVFERRRSVASIRTASRQDPQIGPGGGQGVRWSRNDILNLIFAPGFSTAETLTPSPDAVSAWTSFAATSERLRGKIEIETAVERNHIPDQRLP